MRIRGCLKYVIGGEEFHKGQGSTFHTHYPDAYETPPPSYYPLYFFMKYTYVHMETHLEASYKETLWLPDVSFHLYICIIFYKDYSGRLLLVDY